MFSHPTRRPRDRGTYALLAASVERVKIGSSETIDARIRTLARNSPAPLVLIGRTAEFVEGILHRLLWQHRSHGEWFIANENVLAAIASYMPRINQLVSVADRPMGAWRKAS